MRLETKVYSLARKPIQTIIISFREGKEETYFTEKSEFQIKVKPF